MTVAEAHTLRKGDKVLWTWVTRPGDPHSHGQVVGVNAQAVSINWEDEEAEPSVFFYDDDTPWMKIEHATDEPHYEPDHEHDAPVRRRMRRTR